MNFLRENTFFLNPLDNAAKPQLRRDLPGLMAASFAIAGACIGTGGAENDFYNENQ